MFQLVQHIWLWSLAALAVPVIIHLWNTRKGKTLKVGSIALYSESARSHARSFRLSELLLLLLRCLLVVVLVLLLAKPFWIHPGNYAETKGWILAEKNSVREAYHHYKGRIDSLLRAGYQFHYFSGDFEEQAFESALHEKTDSVINPTHSYWQLLKELDRKVPATMPVVLYTNNSLERFRGNRPGVNLNLNWFTYPARDTAAYWLKAAYETIDDSIRVVTGSSKPEETWFTYQTLSGQQTRTDLRMISKEGKTFIEDASQSKDNFERIELDTTSFKVTIYTGKYPEDASYIRAALDAIRDVTRKKITVTGTRNADGIPPDQDWLFWLSDEAVPSSYLKNNVVAYSNGETQIQHSFILTGNNQGSPDSYLQLKADSLENYAEVLWQNGFGQPLLGSRSKGGRVYYLSSRINPQWNDLPWSSQFPQVIYDLVFGQTKHTLTPGSKDIRKIDAQQVFPVRVTEEVFPKEAFVLTSELSTLLWMFAFGMFLFERIIVHFSKRSRSNE